LRGALGSFGGSFGADVPIFLEVDGFAAGARQGVDQAGEALGIAAELLLHLARAEMAEGPEKLGDGDLEGGFVEFAGIEIGQQLQARLLVGAHVLAPFLIFFPALIADTIVPVADIARHEIFADVAEFENNLGVGNPVSKHEIYPIALHLAHAPDFAARTAVLFRRWFLDRWLFGSCGLWERVGGRTIVLGSHRVIFLSVWARIRIHFGIPRFKLATLAYLSLP